MSDNFLGPPAPVPGGFTVQFGPPPLVRLWDSYPLERGAWGTIAAQGVFDTKPGGVVEIRRLVLPAPARVGTRWVVNPPVRYVPAAMPILPGYQDGPVRACYRPTAGDLGAVQSFFPSALDAFAVPWLEVSARLLGRHARAELERLAAPELLALLLRTPPADPSGADQPSGGVASALAAVYAGAAVANRFAAAVAAVQAPGTVDQRLNALDLAVPIPPTASASCLARLLGCTPAAVKQSSWWRLRRRGRREEEQERRRRQLRRPNWDYHGDD